MTLELAAIQHDIAWEAPTETMALVRPLILDAAAAGAELVALPEMWSCGFSMNTAVVAESPDGPTASFMHEMAHETGCWIAGSVPERTDGYERPTNRFILAGQAVKTIGTPRQSRSRMRARPITMPVASRSLRSV